jgi:hypothetical protein
MDNIGGMKSVLTLSCAGLAAYLAEGCAGGLTSPETALPDLSAHQWRHRVLVIDTPSRDADEYRRQSAALAAASAGLQERHVEIVTQTAKAFRVRLVGKDGGVKLDRGEPVDVPTLFALIDAMPMRRAEMSGR